MMTHVVRTIAIVAAVLPTLAGPLAGQENPRRERLQRQVVERFMENFRARAGLSDDQFRRFQEVTRGAFASRAARQRRERALWEALEGQMRPGVAADQDSVLRLLDGLIDLQAEQVEGARDDLRRYAEFLTPVQQAQLVISLRRLQEEIERIIRERLQEGAGGAPSRGVGSARVLEGSELA